MTDEDSQIVDFDAKPSSTADQLRLAEAQADLKRRCSESNVLCEEVEDPDGNPGFVLRIPRGREHRAVYVSNLEEIEALLAVPFEQYFFLSDYDAICSYTAGTIEATLSTLGARPLSPYLIYRRLTGRSIRRDEPDPKDLVVELRPESAGDGVVITIGPVSEDLHALLSPSAFYLTTLAPSIMISGLTALGHDQAVNYLERIADAVFFEIDMARGVPLTLQRDRPLRIRSGTGGTPRTEDLPYPHHEYDRAPMSLYWYARSASGLPLLRFLAYYQSIEFYFLTYSHIEARRRMRNILKNPTFTPHNDIDINRLLDAVRVVGSRGFGDESSQLRATLQECLDPDSLRAFIIADDERRDFLSKSKLLRVHTLPLSNPNADLRTDVANRIYQLRNRIVHTKQAGGNGELDLLLPFSVESESLQYDLELLHYVSQQVLIANSKQLRL